jgi:hypothetical protein
MNPRPKRSAVTTPPASKPQGSRGERWRGPGAPSRTGGAAAEIPVCTCGHSIEEHGNSQSGACDECNCICFDRT